METGSGGGGSWTVGSREGNSDQTNKVNLHLSFDKGRKEGIHTFIHKNRVTETHTQTQRIIRERERERERERNGSSNGIDEKNTSEANGDSTLSTPHPFAPSLFRSPLSS